MNYIYKLSKDINVTIEDMKFFYRGLYGKNISTSDELEILLKGDMHYNFINSESIEIFKTILKLSTLEFGVYVKILDSNSRYNGYQYSTNLNIPREVSERDSCKYLYNNIKLCNEIEEGSSVILGLGVVPSELMILFLQIIYKNKDISKLPNYDILYKLLDRCDKKDIGGEITLKYDLEDYIEYEHSIFPLLVELEKVRIVKIKGIEILEGDICFYVRIIDEIKNIKPEDIVGVFGASDKGNIHLLEVCNIDFECKGMFLVKGNKTIQVTPFKLKLLEYTMQNIGNGNCSWEDILSYVYGEGMRKSDALMSLIKKVNTNLRDIESVIQIGYVSDKYIFFKRT